MTTDLQRVGVVNVPTNTGTRVGLVLPTLAAAQFVMLLDSSECCGIIAMGNP